jgi:hypothetical protein
MIDTHLFIGTQFFGTHTLTYNVTANPFSTPRTGIIEVSDQPPPDSGHAHEKARITVQQAAAPGHHDH